MATFGRCSESGASEYGAQQDRLYLGEYVLSEDGCVSQITIYGSAVSGSFAMKACIYDDDGGDPGNLKGVSSETSVGTNEQWWTFTFDPAVSLSAGTYWMGWNHDGTVDFDYFYVAASGEGRYSTSTTYDVWPNPAGSLNNTDKSFCVCATYTTGGGGLTIPVAMHHYGHHIGKIIRG